MLPEQAMFAAILTCVAGAGIALLVARWQAVASALALAATAASAGLACLACWQVLSGGGGQAAAGWLAAGAAWQGLQVDGLTSVFLLLTAVVALPACLFSLRCLQHYPERRSRYFPHFLLFLAAVYGLFSTADTLWWFLCFWQLMVFSGYELIRSDRAAGARGATRFAIMMELACGALIAGTGLLAHSGAAGSPAYAWHTFSSRLPMMLTTSPADSVLAFVLLFLGFAIVMGMWPFGEIWLPHASSVSPAPVSALLCGVVIKLGVYGLIRYFVLLAPLGGQTAFPFARWGMALAVLGTITLLVGTMQALRSKQLLAFHSIGQMGYIALAVGTCLGVVGARGASLTALAGLALMAALFHVVNHGLFSTLLYFNSGAVLQATGTKDMDRLGGVMKYMPLTGLTALVASLSISGVPLLNGFASKWAIFVAAIQGASWVPYLSICALLAILTSGLTLASFIKFFGAIFLSRTSALVREKAGLARDAAERHTLPRKLEVHWSMLLPQLLLALLCVLLGLAPGLAFVLLQRAIGTAPQGLGPLLAQARPAADGAWAGIAGPNSAAMFAPLWLVLGLAATFAVAYGISRLGAAPRRAAAPWLCGYAREAECHRYSAHNFYGEIKRHFGWLGGGDEGKPAVVKGRAS